MVENDANLAGMRRRDGATQPRPCNIQSRRIFVELEALRVSGMISIDDRTRLETQLALTELLITLAEESAEHYRAPHALEREPGDILSGAVANLAMIEAAAAVRKAERKRLLRALSASPQPPVP